MSRLRSRFGQLRPRSGRWRRCPRVGEDADRRADAQRRRCRSSLARRTLSVLVVDASMAVELSLDRIGDQSRDVLGDDELVAPTALGSSSHRTSWRQAAPES